jgi:hypothetical protein
MVRTAPAAGRSAQERLVQAMVALLPGSPDRGHTANVVTLCHEAESRHRGLMAFRLRCLYMALRSLPGNGPATSFGGREDAYVE